MNCYILTTVPTNTNTLFSNKSTQFMNDRQKRTVINQHKCCEKNSACARKCLQNFFGNFFANNLGLPFYLFLFASRSFLISVNEID